MPRLTSALEVDEVVVALVVDGDVSVTAARSERPGAGPTGLSTWNSSPLSVERWIQEFCDVVPNGPLSQ